MSSLVARAKEQARALGFSLVGIARAAEADGFARLSDWLARGFAGDMAYMHRHAAARRHPAAVLPEVRSVVMVGMEYGAVAGQARSASESKPSTLARASGLSKIARYARGPDYHLVLRERLNRLLDWVREQSPACVGRGVVDTAPLLE